MYIFFYFFYFAEIYRTKYVPLSSRYYPAMTEEQRIKELRQRLNYYNYRYYIENDPAVSDYEFDTLLRELQDLEATHPEMADPNSPTARVGSDVTNEFRRDRKSVV